MYLKLISFTFLLCFAFASLVEARHPNAIRTSSRHVTGHKQKVTRATVRKKPGVIVTHKRAQCLSKSAARSRNTNVKTTHSRTKPIRARQSHKVTARTKQPRAVAAKRTPAPKIQSTRRIARRSTPVTAVKSVQPPIPVVAPKPISPPVTYLSSLRPYAQKNAKLGGLDVLYSKNLLGQGQTVAVVELSGTWKEMRDVINNPQGNLSADTRERYKHNFLPSIGGPDLHPEEKNAWIHSVANGSHHGSSVSSIVLDLAPHAKILPVSTYFCPQSNERYDLASALITLSQKPGVSFINVSGGHIEKDLESQISGQNEDGTDRYLFRYTFPAKHIEAFKTIADAGKVVVFAAGNEGKIVRGPEYQESVKSYRERFMGYLLENLDLETRKSIIFAGNLDSDTNFASSTSNRPGNWLEAQERFLFAPGKNETSYSPGLIDDGTSNSAPYICAAIANLCSKPGVTPKKAVQALLDSADQRPEKAIYGRGVIRADKALELLERGL